MDAVIISHDRWFLDRLATHILAFEGNFSDYEEAKRKRLNDMEPKHLRYKKLG
jgi:sulfate-transporting ATPase